MGTEKMAMCGGLGQASAATAEHQAICDKVKADVESKTNRKFSEFVAVKVSSQMVAGTNFFIKVKVDASEHIHIRVYQKLPHEGYARIICCSPRKSSRRSN